MSRRKRILLGVLFAGVATFLVGAVSGRIPVRPLFTFLQFKLRPDKVRTQQLVQLKNPATQQTVFLIGTTHQYHYEDPAYSIWHVKAAVTGLGVDTAFIEMMSDAVAEGRLGEGPVEMPFVATAAKEAGIHVVGVDSGWDGGWRGRQDRMYAQVKARLTGEAPPKRALIASGFMHVSQFQAQLEEDGFVVVAWSDDEKRAVVDRDVEKTWPAGFEVALTDAIARARAGKMDTDPERKADLTWFVEVREQVLKKVRG